jgi:hypothetical protein
MVKKVARGRGNQGDWSARKANEPDTKMSDSDERKKRDLALEQLKHNSKIKTKTSSTKSARARQKKMERKAKGVC